jgi:hypothetical protein
VKSLEELEPGHVTQLSRLSRIARPEGVPAPLR